MSYVYNHKKKISHSYSSLAYYDYWITKEALCKALLYRLKDEKDSFILVTGFTGSGKSTLVANLCFNVFSKIKNFINKKMGRMFDKDCFVTDAKQFAYMMAKYEGKVIWYDEARDGMDKRSWFSEIHKRIVDRKNTNRKLFNTYFICMPFEKEVDKAIASHICLWIWVRRGVGEIYCPMVTMKGGSSLSIPKILEREEKWKKENPQATFVPPTIHDEFIGRIAFPKLSQKQRKIYLAWIKEKSATGKIDEKEEKENNKEKVEKPENVVKNLIKKLKKKEITTRDQVMEIMDTIDSPLKQKMEMLDLHLKTYFGKTLNKMFEEKEKEKKKIDKTSQRIAELLN